MRLKKRLLVVILVVALVLPGVLLSPALPAAAASSNLYGTGSADEINIVKLLDMALNRGGMSMSPATIRAFLEFWWSSVQEDLNSCISNVDTSITGTQAFISALGDIIDAPEHADKLGGILKKYLSFVATMEYETLSDFKSLLTQQDTFRKFLLSYVVDEEGNIAGTVNNKLKKYRLKSEFVNLTRKAADAYIDEYEGYYLLATHKISDVSPTSFSTKDRYDAFLGVFEGMSDSDIIYHRSTLDRNYNYYDDFYDVTTGNFIFSSKDGTYISFSVINDNWESCPFPHDSYRYSPAPLSGNDFTILDLKSADAATLSSPSHYFSSLVGLYTVDGRSVKVWKTLDGFKQYSAGKSNIYYTKDYSGYDMTADNSIGFTGSYYSSNSSSYSHDVIQNTIDNSSEVNESTVNNIVNNYITNNNYGDGSGSGGSGGSGDSGNGWWNIGDGIAAVIEGIASLLDFLLKLIGDLVNVLAKFLSGLLEIMGSFAALGDGFGTFLKAAFGFLPEECIDIIVISVGIMCAVGVFKIFKK